MEDVLSKIKSLVKYYNKLINPKNESDKGIRTQLEYINRLEINVAYPFLMKVYEDYANSIIDRQTFISILDLVQSFTWRRFIVGIGTEGRNKIFMTLYDKVNKENYLYSVQKALLKLTGNSRFPKNTETINALKEKDVYNIKAKNRTYLLERLENFQNKEPVIIDDNPDITIEHIFPQNPDQKWKTELSTEDYHFIKENHLNTIGNLTLSGNNGKLGNKIFSFKRDLENAGYKDSRLWLNKYLAGLEKWDKVEIEKRLDLIAERFLKVWQIPEITISDELSNSEINIFDADDPIHKKLDYAIFLDQKFEIREVAKLYLEIFKQLFELQPETFFTTDLGEKIGLTKNPTEDNLRKPVQLNDTYFIESHLNNMTKFDRLKHALTLFDFEDELIVKYAEEQSL